MTMDDVCALPPSVAVFPSEEKREKMLAERVGRFIAEHKLLRAGERVLVGVSGGADSVVLLHLLHRLGYAVEAAHVHHGLRADAAEADLALVRAHGERLGIRLHLLRADAEAYAEKESLSVQEAGRALRYDYFARVAESEGLRRVAVAHHLDDQAETLLLNLFRGSGIEGLAGMPPKRRLREGKKPRLVRPLLGVRRREIEAFAREENLPWREDVTNADPAYRRSALRMEILPLIEQHFAGSTEVMARTADLVRGYVRATIEPELRERFAACARAEGKRKGGRLLLKPLEAAPAVWQQRLALEALGRWLPRAPQTAAAAAEVCALMEAQVGRRVEWGRAGAVWCEREALRFVPPAAASAAEAASQLLRLGRRVEVGGYTLRAEALDAVPKRPEAGAPDAAVLDADRLAFPLLVRPWQAGDRLRPLGLDGHKAVSDLLTEAKVPPHRRAGVLVVLSEGEIVWVAGHRLADAVRLRPETRRAVRLTCATSGEPPSST